MIEFTAYKIHERAAGSGYSRPEATALFAFTADRLGSCITGDFEAYVGDVLVAIIPRSAVDAVAPSAVPWYLTPEGHSRRKYK